ncbi:hypothetical protein ABB37_03335 [Leptomonas pyrrhocoris]|uniref:C2CD3 N-terminal C2 domain-containing protein n=1 Tax=Leptomonas pyrrhocoris TaxID=157538 RepID=A0A0M9G4Y4_LEPPY|nr:hypothetical protein ABB37_03335 [Leptomonas pyrrhocoris]KPA82216.1 hypothetical protein ABB37_03335 [Leptomonas pyrrhocoris]|eukprot:XP_015660655.1 hypothetical protein ABB37_03335 [Leptomonas pyrrhocoris]
MQVLYGAPLPPGLVAPTQGELRLRVDQLLLDGDAINHNPLVQLFETDASLLSASRTPRDGAAADGAVLSAGAAPAPTRSPNHFVVPVDYCAVGPIFWGETRPTAQGQPSTPQARRGPFTMAYPIKIEPKQFRAYLQRMTASPQGGVQLDVFVPPSYSGRPPVVVGKARLALDRLDPGHPIQGWYPVLHRRSRTATSTGEEGATAALATSAADGGAELKEIPIGKVKVSVSIEYYPTTRHAPHPRRGEDGQRVPQQYSVKQRRQVEVPGDGGTKGTLPQAKTRRSARHSGRVGTKDVFSSSSSASTSVTSDVDVGVHPIAVRDSHRLHVRRTSQPASMLEQDLPTVTQRLLKQGLQLRAQMDAAARGVDVDAAADFFNEASTALHSGDEHVGVEGASAVAIVEDSGDDLAAVGDVDPYDSTYTSEASHEENFALQMQIDSEARDNRATQQQQKQPQSVATPQQQLRQDTQPVTKSVISAAGISAGNAPASVELCFSHFTFAQTPATADLRQLRLSVRLSNDITTSEPTPGPLSSYVHPVPFQQPSICLHFEVCSFSGDRSRLVVEAYKVVAETEVEGEADAWDMRGPRQVAREELLGLSIVGLYRQSREVVFRDPVLDSSNVFAQLDIRMHPASVTDNADTSVGPAVSPCVTLPSGAVPLRSVAGSSALPSAPPKQQSTSKLLVPHVTVQHQPLEVTDTSRLSHTSAVALQGTTSPPTAPKLQVGNSRLSTSERRRLRVVVHSAAELPRVALAQPDGRPSARYPLVSSNPRVLPEAGSASTLSYTEPSSFVTVEEVFQGLQNSLSHLERKGEELAKSRAHMQSMENWFVDEARSGYYDRSVIVEHSTNPHYDYEVVLQLPAVVAAAVPSTVDETTFFAARNASAVERPPSRGTVDVLEELQLNVWHSDLSQPSAPSTVVKANRTNVRKQEEHFWSCAAYMGTCRVDLRPLRYLAMINGYYRVVCERTPTNATDETDADTEANTIGYVRVSVSLI